MSIVTVWDGESTPVNGQEFVFKAENFRFIGISQSGGYVGQNKNGNFGSYRPRDCKPLSTPKEDAIDEMLLVIRTNSAPDGARVLYKAGYRKINSDEVALLEKVTMPVCKTAADAFIALMARLR